MKITEALFAEHLVFHNMFDHLEAKAPTIKTLAELKALAAVMEAMLKAHSDTEDNLFIGPLEHCFEQEPSPGFFKGTCLFDPVDPKTPARMDATARWKRTSPWRSRAS